MVHHSLKPPGNKGGDKIFFLEKVGLGQRGDSLL